MYLNFFGLDRQPFNITPDPALLYGSPSHKEALAALTYGIMERKGFIAIIGDVGVGKTTILRSVLEKLPKDTTRIIHLFNANISFTNLLRTLVQGLEHTPRWDEEDLMLEQFHQVLSDVHQAGINVVLIIDEAQNMPVETLRHLHLLSNLQSDAGMMIQVVFSGQTELDDTLNLNALRQLRQRIAIKTTIVRLTRKESAAYISYRLAKAGHRGSAIFTAGAVRRITRKAAGIPRVINTLCDNCLITAFGKQEPHVTAAIVREIIADFSGHRRRGFPWPVAAPAVVVIVLCTVWLYGRYARFLESAPITPIQPSVSAVVDTKVVDVKLPIPARTPSEPVQPAGEVATAVTQPVSVAPTGKSGKRLHRKEPGKAHKAKGSIPVHKIARKGDTLPGLVLRTYGSVDRRLLEIVRHNNPHIATIDHLQGGERIYFPSREY